MMRCSQCHSRNPIGNKFCRECGERLPAPENDLAAEEALRAEQERAQERVARLLTDAFSLAGQDKTDQAILLAEEAADVMPESTSVQSLLASLYERSGQKEKAITAVRRVVEMNPLSGADRDVLDRLQSGAPAPTRIASAIPTLGAPTARLVPISTERASGSAVATWLPIGAAFMAAAFVLGTGVSLISHSRGAARSGPSNSGARVSPGPAGQQPFGPAAGDGTGPQGASSAGAAAYSMGAAGQPKIDTAPPANGNPDPFSTQTADGARPAGNAPTSMVASALPLPGKASLRDLGGRDFSLSPAPVRLIGVPTGTAGTAAGSDGNGFGNGTRLAVGPPASDGTAGLASAATAPTSAADDSTSPAAAAGRPDDGYIHISVRSPDGTTAVASGDPMTITARPPQPQQQMSVADSGGGGASAADANPLSHAQTLEANGRYRDAIPQYQRAADNDPEIAGEAYQGMALSYQRQEDAASARAAYRRAITAYEAEAATSHDPSAAQRGIASCRAALEVLGD
jgi:tetratricopeptide (TPR) repeat protein